MMKFRLVLYWLSMAVHTGFACSYSFAEDAVAKAMERIVSPHSPEEVVQSRRLLFDIASADRLQILKRHTQDVVAIYAYWEETVRAARSDALPRPIDAALAQRFLGFVEGRLRITVPKWWAKTMVSADLLDASGPPRFDATKYRVCRESGLRLIRDGSDLMVPSDVTVGPNRDNLIISKADRFITIPAKVLGGADCLDVAMDDHQWYLAVYDDVGFAFELLCVEEKRGVLWRTRAWSASRQTVVGVHYQRVELAVYDDRIVVFGAEPCAMFIEIFDRRSGKNTLRFSTWYDNAR